MFSFVAASTGNKVAQVTHQDQGMWECGLIMRAFLPLSRILRDPEKPMASVPQPFKMFKSHGS
jgi:hypothetical protein